MKLIQTQIFYPMLSRKICVNIIPFSELECMEELRDDFSVLNYNIRSFHSHGNVFISAVDSFDLSFDCIVLSETWNTYDNYVRCNIPAHRKKFAG